MLLEVNVSGTWVEQQPADGDEIRITYDNGAVEIKRWFAPVADMPVPVAKSWPAYDFYLRFTPAQRIAIRDLAKTDSYAEDFVRTLDGAIASQSRVVETDTNLVNGLAYLQSNPVGAPCLTAADVAALLA